MLDRYARLAGFLYLTIIVTSILSMIVIQTPLIVDGDPAATVARIKADETLFRAGLVYDMVMFAAVIALAWALYVILRGVDRNQALLGLLWRMAEAIVGAVGVLFGVLIVLLVHSKGLEPVQVQAWVEVLVSARAVGFDVTILFLSLGTIVYGRLLYRSRYIPRALAGLGIAAFVLMLAGALVDVLLPRYQDVVMIGWAPGIVFEAAIGVWLLVKGIQEREPVPAR